tara:strand:- start:543 stop:806 length:264 start_codon:yes stop_codon:yes gene_type:complete
MESKKEKEKATDRLISSYNESIKQESRMKKLMKKMEQLTEQIFGSFEAVIPAEVKEWGFSAHIPFQKKYIGKKVKVIIIKEEDKKED